MSGVWPGSRSNTASDFVIERLFATHSVVTARISSTTSEGNDALHQQVAVVEVELPLLLGEDTGRDLENLFRSHVRRLRVRSEPPMFDPVPDRVNTGAANRRPRPPTCRAVGSTPGSASSAAAAERTFDGAGRCMREP